MKKLFTLIAAALMAVGVSAEETELWSSVTPVKVDWSSADIKIAPEKLTSVKAGDILHVYITDVNTSGGEWGAQVALKDGNYTDLEAGVPVGKGDLSKVEFTITGDILALAKANSLQISGNNYSVTKVSYETGAAEGSAQSVWVGNSTGNVTINANHFKNANGGDGPKAGDIIRVKATAIAGYTKDTYIILSYSGEDTGWSWKNYEGMDATTVDGGFEFAVTEANIAQIKTDGIIVNQGGYTITEVQFPAPAAEEGGEEATGGDTWNFETAVSAADKASLEAEGSTWKAPAITYVKDADGNPTTEISYVRYELNAEISAKVKDALGEFVALKGNNGTELEWTKGLTFTRYSNALGAGNIRLDAYSRLGLNGSGIAMKISGLKKDDIIKIKFASTNEEARGFDLTNAATNDADAKTQILSGKDKAAVEFELKVAADGDVILQTTKGVYIYAIAVNGELPTGIQNIKASAKVIENNDIYNLAGQKVNESYKGIVIKNGKKYFQK